MTLALTHLGSADGFHECRARSGSPCEAQRQAVPSRASYHVELTWPLRVSSHIDFRAILLLVQHVSDLTNRPVWMSSEFSASCSALPFQPLLC